MKKHLKSRRHWLTAALGGVLVTSSQVGCAMAPKPRGFGVVVSSSLMHGVSVKYGVEFRSDSGRHLAGYASLATGNGPGGGQTSGYGGLGVPQWVEVRWRTGKFIQRFDPETNSIWTGGTVVGKHSVDVASRIPDEVLRYASAERGRAIKLMFRILDDAVVLGWCVQEPSKLGGGWIYSNFGGDFMPAKWFNGKVVEPGWYRDPTTGQRIATTTGH
jgi:hypothetical protein